MANENNTPKRARTPRGQFTLLYGDWKRALKAANNFSGSDADAAGIDAFADNAASILIETPSQSVRDVAKKINVLKHYLSIGHDHFIAFLALGQIQHDVNRLAH